MSKERLTVADEDLGNGMKRCHIIDGNEVRKHAMDFYWRLKEYEDLEEQGLLLRLPIAIGTKVYSVLEEQVPKHHYEICECEIEDVSSKAFYCGYEWWEFGSNNFYFSRAEAEEKLRELNEESEE